MPLNGACTASKPAGTTAVANTTIESAKFNSVIDDIYQIFNTARPILYGGTGATTAAGARTALGLAIGSDVQAYSAVLTDLIAKFTPASASAAASLALAEDTDNGVHKVSIQAPASVASDKVQTLQDVTGTLYVSGGTDVPVADGGTGASDASGARANLGLVIGTDVLGPASQAQMEAASSNAVAATPGRLHNHPGVAKCWGFVSYSGGTPTLQTSYNITSITDTGAGRLTFTIATDFSSAQWACHATISDSALGWSCQVDTVNGQTAGAVTILTNDGGGNQDPNAVHMTGYGDQA